MPSPKSSWMLVLSESPCGRGGGEHDLCHLHFGQTLHLDHIQEEGEHGPLLKGLMCHKHSAGEGEWMETDIEASERRNEKNKKHESY